MIEFFEDTSEVINAIISLIVLIIGIRTLWDVNFPMKKRAQRLFFLAFVLFAISQTMAATFLFIEVNALELVKDFAETGFLTALAAAIFFMRESERLEVSSLRRSASTDSLTALFNQGHFSRAAQRRLETAQRHQMPASLIFLDIDDFKSYNDIFGHEEGNVVLRRLAQVLQASVRADDILARYGGEEFVVLILGSRQMVIDMAQRIRQNVETECNPDNDALFKRAITVSVGVASLEAQAVQLEELIDMADKEMYVAKKQGKNRVSVSHVFA